MTPKMASSPAAICEDCKKERKKRRRKKVTNRKHRNKTCENSQESYHVSNDLDLVGVDLAAVPVGGVNHYPGRETGLVEVRLHRINKPLLIVGSVLGTPKNNVTEGVSLITRKERKKGVS